MAWFLLISKALVTNTFVGMVLKDSKLRICKSEPLDMLKIKVNPITIFVFYNFKKCALEIKKIPNITFDVFSR